MVGVQTETPSRLLTAAEVARLLRVDVSTVYRMARRGDLPFVALGAGQRRGRLLRFDSAAVVDYLAKGMERGRRG